MRRTLVRKPVEPVVGRCKIINSAALGEAFVLASDDFKLELDADGLWKGMAVYRESEMQKLVDSKPTKGHVRAVHEVKKWGWAEIETAGEEDAF